VRDPARITIRRLVEYAGLAPRREDFRRAGAEGGDRTDAG